MHFQSRQKRKKKRKNKTEKLQSENVKGNYSEHHVQISWAFTIDKTHNRFSFIYILCQFPLCRFYSFIFKTVTTKDAADIKIFAFST